MISAVLWLYERDSALPYEAMVIFAVEGDTISADARVVQSTALQTAEAALTGESLLQHPEVFAIPAFVEHR
ncbi:MAG TPA: hypothetical protein VFY67_13490 [Pyrinomonadaceae bacterium]|nr:hypothetical protein [Pyrinomonadaceae bacterium]